METATNRTCRSLRKDGQPCQARAITADGRCAAHGGLVDMRAAGQAGGKASVRSRLGIELGEDKASNRLRAKARRALEQALDSDDEKARFAAARSLFSYSPAKPADDEEAPVESLTTLAKTWLRGLAALDQQQLEATLDRETWNEITCVAVRDPELLRAQVKFTQQIAELSARKQQQALAPRDRSPFASTPVSPKLDSRTHESPNGAPAAPSAPPLAARGPGPREQQENAARNEIRERIAWEIKQDWDREPEPGELEERVRRAQAEALEDAGDAA